MKYSSLDSGFSFCSRIWIVWFFPLISSIFFFLLTTRNLHSAMLLLSKSCRIHWATFIYCGCRPQVWGEIIWSLGEAWHCHSHELGLLNCCGIWVQIWHFLRVLDNGIMWSSSQTFFLKQKHTKSMVFAKEVPTFDCTADDSGLVIVAVL